MVKQANLKKHKQAQFIEIGKIFNLFTITSFTRKRNGWKIAVRACFRFSSRSVGVPYSLLKDKNNVI